MRCRTIIECRRVGGMAAMTSNWWLHASSHDVICSAVDSYNVWWEQCSNMANETLTTNLIQRENTVYNTYHWWHPDARVSVCGLAYLSCLRGRFASQISHPRLSSSDWRLPIYFFLTVHKETQLTNNSQISIHSLIIKIVKYTW